LFFLFDPTQDPDFRRACSATSKDPQVTDKARTYRQELVLLEAAERVRRHAGLGQSAQHDRPLIVIVTKFDTWRGLLGDNNLQLSFEQVARRLNDHVSALDLTTIEKVSRSVRQMLMKYRSEFVSAAESFCKEVIYVPVSALGCSPEVDPNGMLCVRSRNIKPMWVEIPMCYALARWVPGLIPSGRRAGSNGQHPFVAEGQTAAQGRAPSPSNRHQ
jgi:hypothetical protein